MDSQLREFYYKIIGQNSGLTVSYDEDTKTNDIKLISIDSEVRNAIYGAINSIPSGISEGPIAKWFGDIDNDAERHDYYYSEKEISDIVTLIREHSPRRVYKKIVSILTSQDSYQAFKVKLDDDKLVKLAMTGELP